MNQPTFVHETTYQWRDIAGIIHRNRLRAIVRTFTRYVEPETRTWADFGCSNGFVMEEILKLKRYSFTRLAGYDNTPELIELAREKKLPAAEFHVFDLNTVVASPDTFDLVTCMETLEHVGHLENAIANLVARVRVGGVLLLTVPNESGLAGLTKYFGRLAFRRNPYGDFFAKQSQGDYVLRLLTYRRTDHFREAGRHGWGPHLGFDYRRMQDEINTRYVKTGQLVPVAKSTSSLGMNLIYVFRRQSG